MKIRNRLAELMAEYYVQTGERLSQDKLSECTGIAQSTISAYVTNRVQRYDADVLSRLLEFFGVDIHELLIVLPDEGGEDLGEAVAVAVR